MLDKTYCNKNIGYVVYTVLYVAILLYYYFTALQLFMLLVM